MTNKNQTDEYFGEYEPIVGDRTDVAIAKVVNKLKMKMPVVRINENNYLIWND